MTSKAPKNLGKSTKKAATANTVKKETWKDAALTMPSSEPKPKRKRVTPEPVTPAPVATVLVTESVTTPEPVTPQAKRKPKAKKSQTKKLEQLDMFGVPKTAGQPRKFATNAERQKAYRERREAKGKRVVTATVLDVSNIRKNTELQSEIIDLSALSYSSKSKK